MKNSKALRITLSTFTGLFSGLCMLDFFFGGLGVAFNGSSDEWWIIIPSIGIPTIAGIFAGLAERKLFYILLIPILVAIVSNFIILIITLCVGLICAIVKEPENMLLVALIAGLVSTPVTIIIFVFFE